MEEQWWEKTSIRKQRGSGIFLLAILSTMWGFRFFCFYFLWCIWDSFRKIWRLQKDTINHCWWISHNYPFETYFKIIFWKIQIWPLLYGCSVTKALSYPFFILFFEKLNLKLLSQTWDRENERSFKFDYRMGKFWGGMFGYRKSQRK